MAQKTHAVTVDGEKYWIRRVDPFVALRLKTLGLRVLGPLFKALASSDSARDFVASMLSEEEGGVKSALEKHGDAEVVTTVLSILGVTLDDLVESVSAEDLERAIRIAVIGHVETPTPGVERVAIEDVETYFDIVGPRMEKHPMHQLELLWRVVMVNLGPTSAGLLTGDPAAEASPA